MTAAPKREDVEAAVERLTFCADPKNWTDMASTNLGATAFVKVRQSDLRTILAALSRPQDGAGVALDRERVTEAVLSFDLATDWPTQKAEDLALSIIAALRPVSAVPGVGFDQGGWLLLSDAPVGVGGLLWCEKCGDRTDAPGIVVEYPDGERGATGSWQGYDWSHWHPYPAAPSPTDGNDGAVR